MDLEELKKNSKGTVWYGMHFYPGVAEYQDPEKGAFRVYLNEKVLRAMDASFTGRPVFVEHVDSADIHPNVDELRKEADGWVVESFYNAADGKHWVKFITVTDRAERAIKRGMRLSNAYLPLNDTKGGLWNGVEYAKEITAGEYEHLAIVENPRYEESIILTPEEFRAYNNEKEIELTRIANSKTKQGDGEMKLSFFKREKVENSAIDLENMMVALPTSGKEYSIKALVNSMDKIENMNGYANGDHMVKVGENEMSVNELAKAHGDLLSKIEAEKQKNAADEDGGAPEIENADDEATTVSEGMKDVGDRGGDESMTNEEDEEEKKKKEKKENALRKARALKNANANSDFVQPVKVFTGLDGVARGKAKYGSN